MARFGKVEDAVVMYDKKTGRSRGFGFITYDNPDVVRKVNAASNAVKLTRNLHERHPFLML